MRAVPPLIEALKDSEWKVRRAAAEALGYFTMREAKAFSLCLIAFRMTERRSGEWSSCLWGGLAKGRLKWREPFGNLLEDPDPVTKMNAQVALAIMGKSDDSAIPALMAALGSKEDTTAKAAGLALSRHGTESPEKLAP